MTDSILDQLGPLAPLAGTWQGSEGLDTSWIHGQSTETPFRETAKFTPLGSVNNGPQALYGLRYTTTAWRLNEDTPFHEEVGYWLWDGDQQQVLRCFMVPRGVLINAGGAATASSRSFHLAAEIGSETYGILSNQFLHASHKTTAYSLDVTIHDDGSFSYEEDTELWFPANNAIFHHTDRNRLYRN